MAIGFYGDESESEGHVLTLAGFMAAPQGWSLLAPKWRQNAMRGRRFAGKLSDLVFRDDRKFVPLQAADLLAYGAAQMRVAARARPRHRAFSLRASEGAPSTPTRGTAVSRPNAALLRRAVSRNAGSGGGGPRNERHTYDHRALARTARSGGLTRGERLAACAENC